MVAALSAGKITKSFDYITGEDSFMIDSDFDLFVQKSFLPDKPLLKYPLFKSLLWLFSEINDHTLVLNSSLELDISLKNSDYSTF